jgi:hypothetical protein
LPGHFLRSNIPLAKAIRQVKERDMPDQTNRREPAQPESQESITDATRHVGRTLESEGNFGNVTGTALPIANRESGNSAEGAPDAVEVRRIGQDRGEAPDSYTDASDPSTAGLLSRATPPLRTRLPGDTSSDPHTDLGPDNASTVQNRPEEKDRNAA